MEKIKLELGIFLRNLTENDIPIIVKAFCNIGWNKPASQYNKYLQEQNNDIREVIVVFENEKFVGYTTLLWTSEYPPFKSQNIPEISDLNVLPNFRKKGIGSLLIDTAESISKKRTDIIGLGVGVTKDYQNAFRLYLKKGYTLDGKGLFDKKLQKFANYGDQILINDDCNFWLTKKILR